MKHDFRAYIKLFPNSRARLLIVSVISYGCFGLSILTSNTLLFLILYVCYGLFDFLGMPATDTLMAKLSPAKYRGLGYALFYMPGNITRTVAPIIAAYIATSVGFNRNFFIAFGLYVIGLFILKLGVKTD